MKKFILPLMFGLNCLNFNAQEKHCYTDQMMAKYFEKHPEAKAAFEQRMEEARLLDEKEFANGYKTAKKPAAATAYTVPVVFHVLHMGGSENISDAQIKDAIACMNRDFSKKNADTINTIPSFTALIANVNFQFELATKDPNGNCTTGITRHFSTHTDHTGDPSDWINTWNPSKYLNIYVVRSINTGQNAAAYTFLPGTAIPNEDAIICLDDYVGTIGTSNSGHSHVLSHETGHWFNLLHVWGSTNQPGVACGNDGVNDTPITKGFSSCPGGNPAICNATITENYQNIMDYSYCSTMFTLGQSARMNTSITSGIAGRNNLWTNANLIATGVINPLSPCTPMADFSYPTFTLCSGKPMTFKDASYNTTTVNPITTWQWATSGTSTISAPNATITSITFGTPGLQTVSLTVSNSNGTNTATHTVMVINGIADYGFTKSESFETGALPPGWTVINNSGGVGWAPISPSAATGIWSFYMHNYNLNPNGAVDILESPSYNFGSDPGATFTFKYAYAKKDAANQDKFKVQASSDCGGTWTDIWTPSNSTLASGSGGTNSTEFFPLPSEFKTYTLTNHPGFGPFKVQNNVRIRFYFEEDAINGFGNNFFLDDINYTDTTVEVQDIGIKEIAKYIGFNLYPNPTNGSATIEFTLSENSNVKYHVCDVTGRIVEGEKNFDLDPGTHIAVVNQNQKLKSGIYFVNFDLNKQRITRKLIIE